MTNQISKFSVQPLSLAELDPDPIKQFKEWFSDAQSEFEPSAMTLATVNQRYEVSARMVLLKEVNSQGFVFFTNYESLKAQQLQEIQQAALVFWWPQCQRQVRITGTVTKASKESSTQYFQQRSFESQIAATISKQSTIIPNRDFLMDKYDELLKKSNHKPLPCPEFWGGYIVKPVTIEFWQGREHRLHDRFLYSNANSIWSIVQLSP